MQNSSFSIGDAEATERFVVAQINNTHREINDLSLALKGSHSKLQRLTALHADIKEVLETVRSREDRLVEMIKTKQNIGEAAVFLAGQSSDRIITAQYAKHMIADRAGMGTPGAIFAYFSRTPAFETVDRGKYRLRKPGHLHSVPSPKRVRN